jgi:hypothetical protein
MYNIIFDPEYHYYKVNGIAKKHYTMIAQENGLLNYDGMPPARREKAFRRGKDVHSICDMSLRRRLDTYSVDKAYAGYYKAFKMFRDRYLGSHMFSEIPFYNPILDYCCTPDAGAVLKNRKGCLLEYKTGKMPKAVIMQLIANYLALTPEYKNRIKVLIALELKKDGTFDVWKCDVDSDQCRGAVNTWVTMIDGTFNLKSFKSQEGTVPFMKKMHLPQGCNAINDNRLETNIMGVLLNMKSLLPKVKLYNELKGELKTLLGKREGTFKIGNKFTVTNKVSEKTNYKIPKEIKEEYETDKTKVMTLTNNEIDGF